MSTRRHTGLLSLVVALAMVLLGVAWGGHGLRIVLIGSGAMLASFGVLRLRTVHDVPLPSRANLALVGFSLAGIGVCFSVAPFVFLSLGRYQLAAITFAGVLIGPYLAFLGYMGLWGATVNTPPPLARQFGKMVGRVANRVTRDL